MKKQKKEKSKVVSIINPCIDESGKENSLCKISIQKRVM